MAMSLRSADSTLGPTALEAEPALPPPPLKWAGGKRWQVPIVRRYWDAHVSRRLVEPFCGGLAIALGLAPARALLNDVNPHLINFYRWVQRGLVPPPLRRSEREYYVRRRRFNALIAAGRADTAEAAGLFYFLNRLGYNGLCRFNQTGEFNVPFGRHKSIQYRADFAEYAAPLAAWTFSSGTFDAIDLEPSDFVYADPPYDVEFTHYSGQHFRWDDQVRTATWLAAHAGPVILSNQATPRILELYSDLGYQTAQYPAPRRISCDGNRAPATEVVATRNLTSAR